MAYMDWIARTSRGRVARDLRPCGRRCAGPDLRERTRRDERMRTKTAYTYK